MLETTAKWTTIIFGVFFIVVGFIMFFKPESARKVIGKAGSTHFINYAEITLRMIPAAALILSATISKYPEVFKVFGWTMLCTSLVLYFVPRHFHHSYSTKAADTMNAFYLRIASPFAFAIGAFIIYCLL